MIIEGAKTTSAALAQPRLEAEPVARHREIRSFDYVNHPYEAVRAALTADTTGVFSSATRAATSRARRVASELHVNIGPLEVGAEIVISVDDIDSRPGGSGTPPSTRILLSWEAASRPQLFPFMDASLAFYPLTSTETQLDFSGHYEPPLGVLGAAIDAVAGHRIAEASVHRFVTDVARHLRETLSD